MNEFVFSRTVPDKYVEGLRSGIYKVSGGVIRNTSGKKTIAAHLIPVSRKGVDSIKNLVPGLLSATMALSAANLIVSVVGFKIVCSKLNDIGRKLDTISEDIKQLLAGQQDISQQLNDHRHARLEAAIIALNDAIKCNDMNATLGAARVATEMGIFYRLITQRLLCDPQKAYNRPDIFENPLDCAVLASITIAHAFALQGRLDMASEKLRDLDQWLVGISPCFKVPFCEKSPPIWLGLLPEGNRIKCCNLMDKMADMVSGIRCMRSQYEFCIEQNISMKQLAEIGSDTGLVVCVAN